jgi:hypothetical protein
VTVPTLALTTQFTTSQSIVAVTSTTTIAPPSGFTALGDYLQAAGNTYAKRDEEGRHQRDILAALDARAAQPVCTSIRFGPNGPTQYPQAYPATVQCNKLVGVVKTSTKFFTAKPTTVTAAQGTVTLVSFSLSLLCLRTRAGRLCSRPRIISQTTTTVKRLPSEDGLIKSSTNYPLTILQF